MAKAARKTSTPEERLKRLQEQVDRRAKKATLKKEIADRRAALKKL